MYKCIRMIFRGEEELLCRRRLPSFRRLKYIVNENRINKSKSAIVTLCITLCNNRFVREQKIDDFKLFLSANYKFVFRICKSRRVFV